MELFNFYLNKAIKLALQIHKDQVDKAGEPYILHPLRVMSSVNEEEEKIVAILHDAIEDGLGDTSRIIFWMFPDEIFDAVILLTREENMSYEYYIERLIISENKIAMKVKLADLADNLSPERLNLLPEEEQKRLYKKYSVTYTKISVALSKLEDA